MKRRIAIVANFSVVKEINQNPKMPITYGR